MLPPIYGFHHICFDKNGKDIFEEQLNTLQQSGLYDATTVIYCTVLGQRNKYILPNKYKIVFEETTSLAFERPLLEYMFKHSTKNVGNYWYIHTKGLSHFGTERYERVRDWRIYMEYFLLKNWKRCYNDLQLYDLAGVNYANYPPHFSGNFWWAKSTYVSRNPTQFQYKDYYETEMWICKANPICISYHKSGVTHYDSFYPKDKYEPLETRQLAVSYSPGFSDVMYDMGTHSKHLDYEKFAQITNNSVSRKADQVEFPS
jgi:hypothetical protein